MTALEEIKKALEELRDKIGLAYDQGDNRLSNLAFWSVELEMVLSTLESLQRKNEELRADVKREAELATHMANDCNDAQARTDTAEAEARRLHYHLDSAACLFETLSENRPADDVDAAMMRVMANEVRTALASTGGEHHADK